MEAVTDIVGDDVSLLKEEIRNLESLVEQLEAINSDQKAQINRLQKDRIRKSVVIQSPPVMMSIKEDGDTSEVGLSTDNAAKLEHFFKMFHTKDVSSTQLSIHGVNSLVSVHQVLFAKEFDEFEDKSKRPNPAAKLGFNYVLEFMRQANEKKQDIATSGIEYGYPISWLMSLFPYVLSKEELENPEKVTDQMWMPLHFALAIETSMPGFDNNKYIGELEVLLEEFGHASFEEDVSPLSMAVSTARPNLEAVQLILEFRPDAARKTDEDGSLPFMHACANNVDLDTIQFLYEAYPEAATATDSFGCAAIHYAAFYGTVEVVQYLLSINAACAGLVEGNGALPLHDAVQNKRNNGRTEMVEMLLQANPDGVRKRDDFGAFPLHKAAKFATLNVVQLLHKAFPKAVYGPDIEGLLPMHYVAEREDKDQHLLQFIVQANPQSKTMEDTALFAADTSSSSSGGWLRSMWGSKPSVSAPPPPPPSAPTAAKAVKARGGGSAGRFASASPPTSPVTHNKRKSVRPVRGSIHEQYGSKR